MFQTCRWTAGRPTAAVRKAVNVLSENYGCHRRGTVNAGTKSVNPLVDHRPRKGVGTT